MWFYQVAIFKKLDYIPEILRKCAWRDQLVSILHACKLQVWEYSTDDFYDS